MNAIGLVAFALVGSAEAIREAFDLFDITVVGLTMAFVGGATRDLLVTRVPLAPQSPVEITLGLVGVGLTIALSVVLPSPDTHPITVVSDVIGLAVLATTGAIVATETGVSAFGIVAIAIINTVGGGAIADILLDRSPFILFDDFYASCAVVGGAVYWIATSLGAAGSTAAVARAVVTVGTRLAAVTYDRELPSARKLGLVHK
jgi:uncharacterized membrane protein YeiH